MTQPTKQDGAVGTQAGLQKHEGRKQEEPTKWYQEQNCQRAKKRKHLLTKGWMNKWITSVHRIRARKKYKDRKWDDTWGWTLQNKTKKSKPWQLRQQFATILVSSNVGTLNQDIQLKMQVFQPKLFPDVSWSVFYASTYPNLNHGLVTTPRAIQHRSSSSLKINIYRCGKKSVISLKTCSSSLLSF